MKANLITVICLSFGMFLISSCKKDSKEDNTPPPLTAAGLSSGRAGIQLTQIGNYFGTNFDVSNTTNTSATTQPAFGNTTIRSIWLKATILKDNFLSRQVTISVAVPNTTNTANGTIIIDLSVQSAPPPQAWVRLESYTAYLGTRSWDVTSGTLTITKLTATEIEGSFTGTAITTSPISGPVTISKGLFAGKF